MVIATRVRFEMPERVITWIDRIATIKAGVTGAVISGGLGVLENIDWLAALGVVVAVLTAVAQFVRIWTDLRRDRREHVRHKRNSVEAAHKYAAGTRQSGTCKQEKK